MNSSPVTHPSSTRRLGADIIELLGSMRFAVSLLMFICVASLLGTVLQQNQPANNYIDQFGPFWFALFDKFSIRSEGHTSELQSLMRISYALFCLKKKNSARHVRLFKNHVYNSLR